MFAPVSAQIEMLQDTFWPYILKLYPFKNPPSILLDVKGGLHNGCAISVQDHSFTIGSAHDNDIVLLDDHVGAKHLTASVYNSLLGPLAKIMVHGSDLEICDEPISTGASSRHLKLPLNIRLTDEIEISLATNRIKQRQKRSLLDRLFRRFVVTSAFLALSVLSLVVWQPSTDYALALPIRELSIAPKKPDISAGDLRTKLADVQLDESVTVQETADGVLLVQGSLTPAQMEIWQDVSRWYDSFAQTKPMIKSFQTSNQLPVIPPVSMVRLSDPKAVILSSGEELTLNSQFAGDWQVAAIEYDHIVISRGQDREVLGFAGRLNE